MGKLRFEVKVKPLLSESEYEYHRGVLAEAQKAAAKNHVYWDLEANEKPRAVRKAFLYVAEKEGVSLRIRGKRDSNSLQLTFGGKQTVSGRLSAGESRNLIVEAISTAGSPVQKSQIIAATGISHSSWNLRIRELLQEGSVVKTGQRRDTRYSLP